MSLDLSRNNTHQDDNRTYEATMEFHISDVRPTLNDSRVFTLNSNKPHKHKRETKNTDRTSEIFVPGGKTYELDNFNRLKPYVPPGNKQSQTDWEEGVFKTIILDSQAAKEIREFTNEPNRRVVKATLSGMAKSDVPEDMLYTQAPILQDGKSRVILTGRADTDIGHAQPLLCVNSVKPANPALESEEEKAAFERLESLLTWQTVRVRDALDEERQPTGYYALKTCDRYRNHKYRLFNNIDKRDLRHDSTSFYNYTNVVHPLVQQPPLFNTRLYGAIL